MQACAGAFLGGRVSWLEEEGGLGGEEEAGGVEELGSVSGGTVGMKAWGRRRTGWAEKRISLWENMAPHTIAASCASVSTGREQRGEVCLRSICLPARWAPCLLDVSTCAIHIV